MPEPRPSSKHMLLNTLAIVFIGYLFFCVALYFFQERLIFFPTTLPKNYTFSFKEPFEERFIPIAKDASIHGLLFTTKNTKGLVFYLHGNAGALDSWGYVAELFTAQNYDCFIIDYRGYGKSDGKIFSEQQFYSDAQLALQSIQSNYRDKPIVIVGESIGTGAAAMLAANNDVSQLVLLAPYYSMIDLAKHIYPIVPGFLLKYPFKTHLFLTQVDVPITIFHGTKDEVIYYESSLKLKNHFKKNDQLISLQGIGHNSIRENYLFKASISKLLKN